MIKAHAFTFRRGKNMKRTWGLGIMLTSFVAVTSACATDPVSETSVDQLATAQDVNGEAVKDESSGNAANHCGLPTHAHPNSIWIPPSYENCLTCINLVFRLNTQFGLHDYCTYNPSNGKTDHHRDL
jgi:hypothetical protein